MQFPRRSEGVGRTVENPGIGEILALRTVAIVGLSKDSSRPSNIVGKYLKEAGYRIVPVNPNETEILGEKCYPSLSKVDFPIDVVDVFRKSEAIPGIVDEALSIQNPPKAIWLQEGITSPHLSRARERGILTVENLCMKKEHSRLFGSGSP